MPTQSSGGPDTTREGMPSGFVGRDQEVAAATGALTSGRALVFIEGEPGIGKSRLAAEILRSVELRPEAVLVLTGLPMPDSFPLGVLADGLRRHARRRDDLAAALAGLSRLGGCLHALLPDWSPLLPPPLAPESDPRATRLRLRGALVELVGVLGIELVVLEDAHWSDAATLECLLLLADVDDGPSVLVTDRPNEVPDSSPLLRLRSRRTSTGAHLRLTLAPLDVDDVARLAGTMLDGEDVSHAFAEFLREHTDGVPLAVEESMRLLRERHDIELRDGRWARRALDEIGVPPSVVDSVRERLTRLPGPARRLLEAAAVLADDASSDVLHSVAHGGAAGEAEIESLAAALSSGLLREVRPAHYAFRHSLDAEAVLAAAAPPRVRALHRRALDVLADRTGTSVVRLAHHAKEAGDTSRWQEYAERVADVAIDTGDDETAILTLVAVIESADDLDGTRLSALVDRLEAARAIGGGTSFATGARAAEALHDVIDRGRLHGGALGTAMLERARFLWGAQRERAAYEVFERAIPLLEDRPDEAVRAMVNLAFPMIREWPADRHLAWLDRADTLLATTGSTISPPLEQRVAALLVAGRADGWRALEDLLSTREAASPPALMLNVVLATFPWGHLRESRRLLDDEAAAVTASNHLRLADVWKLRSAQLDWYAGSWRAAWATLAGLEQRPDITYLADPEAATYAEALECYAGDTVHAPQRLEALAARLATSDSVLPTGLDAAATLAHLAASAGRHDAALAHTEPLAEMVARRGVWLWAVEFAVSHVDALLGLGDRTAAVAFVDRFEAGTAGLAAPTRQAVIGEARAAVALRLGDADTAVRLARQAAQQWAAMPRVHRELLALERAAAGLAAGGRQGEAVSLLEGVHDRLRTLGSTYDAARVARTLRTHGTRTRRPERSGRAGYGDQLSPRELEVLHLVAQGMTNKEVAAALFLSPKTVGLHLGSAMRKLGVHTRTAAAVAARETGLLEDSSPRR